MVRSLTAAMIAAMLVIVAGVPIANTAALPPAAPTQTPINYLVVIDDENVSFDHYFAT